MSEFLGYIYMAEGLAISDEEEEVAKHPELASQKEQILRSKSMSYEKILKEEMDKKLANFDIGGQLLNNWFLSLPQDQQELFGKEMEALNKKTEQQEELIESLFNSFFSPTFQTPKEIYHLSDALFDALKREVIRLQEAGCYVEASCLGQLVLSLDPTMLELYYQVGYAFLRLGELEEAQRYFDCSVGLDQLEPKGYYLAAFCSHERRDGVKAKLFCQTGIEVAEEYPTWKKMLIELKQTLDREENTTIKR